MGDGETTVLVETDTAVVEVTGGDRASYLDDVTTQRIGELEPGQVRSALVLDANGAPQAVFDVIARPERLVLLTPEPLLSEVVDELGGRTFLLEATFTHLAETAVTALRGKRTRQVAGEAGIAVPDDGAVEEGELLVVARPRGVDLVGPSGALEQAGEALVAAGARRGEDRDLDAWRVEMGVPAWDREITSPHLPEEAGVLPTHVHLGKGCYPGQEAVARMWMLGRPRRRLARVELSPPVEEGAELGERGGRVSVTTLGRRHGDSAEALAYVPRDAGAGEALELEETTVTVIELVGAGMDVPGHDPSVQRRRDRG